MKNPLFNCTTKVKYHRVKTHSNLVLSSEMSYREQLTCGLFDVSIGVNGYDGYDDDEDSGANVFIVQLLCDFEQKRLSRINEQE